MFDVLEASNFPTEPPLELTPPEDLVEELTSAFRRREHEDVRIARLLHLVNETRAFAHDGYSSSTALLKAPDVTSSWRGTKAGDPSQRIG